MGLLDRFLTQGTKIEQKDQAEKPEQKNHADYHRLFEYLNDATPSGSIGKSYNAVAKQAYQANPTVRRCVDLRANAISSLVWVLKDRQGREVTEHPVLDLLKRPNAMHQKNSFFGHHQIHKLVGGQAFIRVIMVGNTPVELSLLRPDLVEVLQGRYEMPAAYRYTPNTQQGSTTEFQIDPVTGDSQVLRSFFCDPLDDLLGHSPLHTALGDIGLQNAGTSHNSSMFKNGAKVAAILSYLSDVGEEARKKLQEKFQNEYVGTHNAGKTVISDGTDFRYQKLQDSAVEMDYVNSSQAAIKNIASAMGVPLALVGIEMTFSNLEAGHLQFYTDTILPEADDLAAGLTYWLLPKFADLDGYELSYDRDQIEALEPLRREKYVKLQSVSFLSVGEKREAIGYPTEMPKDNADMAPESTEASEPDKKPNNDPLKDDESDVDPEQGKKQNDETIEVKDNRIEIKAVDNHTHLIDPTMQHGTTSKADDGHTHTFTKGAKNTSVTNGHRHELTD